VIGRDEAVQVDAVGDDGHRQPRGQCAQGLRVPVGDDDRALVAVEHPRLEVAGHRQLQPCQRPVERAAGLGLCPLQEQAVAFVGRDQVGVVAGQRPVLVDLHAAEQVHHVNGARPVEQAPGDGVPHLRGPAPLPPGREAAAGQQGAGQQTQRAAGRLPDERHTVEETAVVRDIGHVLRLLVEGQQVYPVAATGQLPHQMVRDQAVAQMQRVGRAARDQQDTQRAVAGQRHGPRSSR